MQEWILQSIEERVLTLALNNPAARNAWTPQMEQALKAALLQADANPEVRAIILTGHGDHFCPGPDGKSLKAAVPSQTRGDESEDLAQRYSYILALNKPVIAAINGAVAGVGLCVTLYCDLRFMVEDAKLTTAFSRRGLVAEHGSAWMLSRLIGPMNAADLLLSGRVLNGREAESLGLVRALPREGFLASVQAYARDLARNASPRSMAVIKKQLGLALSQSLAQATAYGEEETAKALTGPDFVEGIAHFVEKRPAEFPDLHLTHI